MDISKLHVRRKLFSWIFTLKFWTNFQIVSYAKYCTENRREN
jgi:hypothetical protein